MDRMLDCFGVISLALALCLALALPHLARQAKRNRRRGSRFPSEFWRRLSA
jgi:hypothetical protein